MTDNTVQIWSVSALLEHDLSLTLGRGSLQGGDPAYVDCALCLVSTFYQEEICHVAKLKSTHFYSETHGKSGLSKINGLPRNGYHGWGSTPIL